ncbi:hypothetical protein B0H67DRAFT_638682 [Lasiosphaeris hirsuta]|uniref:Uncharacterized protein n=1 Tax=Lasiosphaeris hirsuta TaxID=260670 RepID=A0AA40E6L3_9PEZI|nr:hypothetical protein B0H67DRAFT_638682 [Lasiosphaeris hirsuta]
MESTCTSTLKQPWKEWYKPTDGPLGGRMVIPYMAAGNGGGGTLSPNPEKPDPPKPATEGEKKAE